MNTEQIKEIQRRIGTAPDGIWGPKSKAAVREHLLKLVPVPNPWPASDTYSLANFYGAPGDERNLVTIEFPYPMFYGGKRVTHTRVNRRCAASLLKVLRAIRDRLGDRPDVIEDHEDYGGVYNFRVKRGGSTYSLHAYGAAIDLDADDNTFRDPWPTKADMPLEIMEEFAKEGWLPAGALWGYDAMHFQATRWA